MAWIHHSRAWACSRALLKIPGEDPDRRRAEVDGQIDPMLDVRDFFLELRAGWIGEGISHRRARDAETQQERVPAQLPAVLRRGRLGKVVGGGLDRIQIPVSRAVDEIVERHRLLWTSQHAAERVGGQAQLHPGRAVARDGLDRLGRSRRDGRRPSGGQCEKRATGQHDGPFFEVAQSNLTPRITRTTRIWICVQGADDPKHQERPVNVEGVRLEGSMIHVVLQSPTP